MGTILETGAEGETWRSEHTGFTVTHDQPTTRNDDGSHSFGGAAQAVADHDAGQGYSAGVEEESEEKSPSSSSGETAGAFSESSGGAGTGADEGY